MRAPDPLSAARGVIVGIVISLVLWVAVVTLVFGIAKDKANRGELITLQREIGQ